MKPKQLRESLERAKLRLRVFETLVEDPDLRAQVARTIGDPKALEEAAGAYRENVTNIFEVLRTREAAGQ